MFASKILALWDVNDLVPFMKLSQAAHRRKCWPQLKSLRIGIESYEMYIEDMEAVLNLKRPCLKFFSESQSLNFSYLLCWEGSASGNKLESLSWSVGQKINYGFGQEVRNFLFWKFRCGEVSDLGEGKFYLMKIVILAWIKNDKWHYFLINFVLKIICKKNKQFTGDLSQAESF